MQRVFNYGSFLQSYALKSMLEEQGHEVSFVDIEYAGQKTQEGKKSPLEKYLKKLKYLDSYFFKRMEYSKKNSQLNAAFPKWHEEYFHFGKEVCKSRGLDGVAIGSDEIFNCDPNSVWGITRQRFGDIPGVAHVFSYAASCGYTALEDLSKEDKTLIGDSLGKMCGVSVRDENTFRFVKELTGKEPERNLDPVLGFDFSEEVELGEAEGVPAYPYMIVYAYHNRIDSKEEIQAIRKYAKKHGLKTIAIGGSLPWCDEFAILSPFQVLAYFKNAACIVTNTFHGTVISAKFNKPLAVLVRESNANKLDDLIKRLHIEDHKVSKMDQLEAILDRSLSYEECNEILEREKIHTRNYLKRVLSSEQN